MNHREVVKNKQFRRLFEARIISNIGNGFYYIAVMWLVYDLTGDPFYSGLAGFVFLVPDAFQFLAGPVADRWPIRKLLVGTHLSQGIVVSVIPVAYYFDVLDVKLILFVMLLLSSMDSLGYPAEFAALPRILDDEKLPAANSLHHISGRVIDVFANSIAGIAIAIVGTMTLLVLDAVTFVIAAILFATLNIPSADSSSERDEEDSHEATDDDQYVSMLKEGVKYTYGTYLQWLMIGSMFLNFTSGVLFAALPAYADSVNTGLFPDFFSGIGVYGILLGSITAGLLIGSVISDHFSEVSLGRLLTVGLTLTTCFWIAVLVSDTLLFTSLFIAASMIPPGIINIQTATVFQSVPPERLVGRVSALRQSVSSALVPIGSLIGGTIASLFTPRIALAMFLFGSTTYLLIVIARSDLRTLPKAHNTAPIKEAQSNPD